jgi:anaerobic magnesium-protoporphyrin IX monomethyl ester cyclase
VKVLLINAGSNYVLQKTVIPLGLLSIATNLKKHGHEVWIYDRAAEGGSIKKRLREIAPDVVGISSLTFGSFRDALKVSACAKKRGLPVIWGGQIPSLVPEVVLRNEAVDAVVIGDGEFAMLELLEVFENKKPLSAIEGLAYKMDGEVIFTKQRALADLADFPVIDWSFVDPGKYFIRNVSCKRTLHVYSSKGCPGQCTYCYSPCFSRRSWRARPMEHILSEIAFLVGTYKLDGIYFADDLISPDKDYLSFFCDAIKTSGIQFFWGCNMRADTCTREELQMMYDAGCRWILFGIESGSKERQQAIKKRLDLDKAKTTIRRCREIGILTTTSFIVGYPDETVKELKETVGYMLELESDVRVTGTYGVIPKSELFDYLLKNGKIEEPQTFEDWDKLKWLDKMGRNLSCVPAFDLKVIVNWFFLMIIRTKSGNSKDKTHFWAKRLVGQTIDFFKMGSLKSIVLLALSAKQFIKIVFYATMFPCIRKKYGLYAHKNRAE